MSHDIWLERADVFTLGALDPDERERFEDHLASGCAECERHLIEAREAGTLLARSLVVEKPDASVKRKVFAAIARESPAGPRRRGVLTWSRVASAVSAIAAMLVAAFLLWDNSALKDRVRALEAEAVLARADIARRKEIYRLLESPDVLSIPLLGQGPSPDAAGRLLWSPKERSGVLITRGLPQAAAGHTYTLWAIAESGPVRAGNFEVDDAGKGQLRITPLTVPAPTVASAGTFRRFAVTIEPGVGGTQPTGATCLVGGLDATGPA